MVKAVSLLESLVVMGIIAALMGLGYVGLISFQNYIEIQNAYADISSFFKSLQNNARNLVGINLGGGNPATVSVPDFYAVTFTATNYSYNLCNAVSDVLSCTVYDANILGIQLQEVRLQYGSCRGIGFRKLTGDIVAFGSDNRFFTTGTCTIRIVHPISNQFKEIVVDLTNNNINI